VADQFDDFDDEINDAVIDDQAEAFERLIDVDDVNIQRGINGQPPLGNSD
jgi:succinate dehydrogenase flavin-adding protein (antitoxin of CptAB toxin-antitoxin module)